MVSQVVIYAAAALAFLVSAKAHGRQLRLEREQAGITSVTFGRGATNAPFVIELWRRERWIFWGTAAAVAALLVALHRLPWPLRVVLVPMTVGFVVGGVASLVRSRTGGASWWLATAAACGALAAALLR